MRIVSLFYHLPNNTNLTLNTSCPIPIIMPTKCRRKQFKSARAASLEYFKKRRFEANLLPNSAQFRIDKDKLSTANTTDTEGESVTWFWSKSAYKTNSDTEEEGNSNLDEMNSEGVESRTERAISTEVQKVEIKWIKEGQDKLCGGYRKNPNETSKISLGIEERSLKNVQYLATIATKSRPGHGFNGHYLEGTYS